MVIKDAVHVTGLTPLVAVVVSWMTRRAACNQAATSMNPKHAARPKSGSRVHCSEAGEQLAPISGDVFKRDLVQFSEEGSKSCAKQVAQLKRGE